MLVDLTPSDHRDKVLARFPDIPDVVRLDVGMYRMGAWKPQLYFQEGLIEYRNEHCARLTEEERALPEDKRYPLAMAKVREIMDQHEREARDMRRIYSQRYSRNWPWHTGDVPDYGIVDTPAQVLERFPHLADDEKPRILTFTEHRRLDQHPTQGFRYHKNGKYWGRQRPRHEHLFDDTHIERVWTFHHWQVIPSPAQD